MKCPNCNEKMRVSHVFAAGGRGETRELKCPSCRTRYTTATFLVEREQIGGARKVASLIKEGRYAPEIKREED